MPTACYAVILFFSLNTYYIALSLYYFTFYQLEAASTVFPLFLPFSMGETEWKATSIPSRGDGRGQTGLFIFNSVTMKGAAL